MPVKLKAQKKQNLEARYSTPNTHINIRRETAHLRLCI